MSQPLFQTATRWLLMLSSSLLLLAQFGCAYPVAVQPSIAVSSHMGPYPVYGQVGVPGPVMVMPPPRGMYASPVYAAPMNRTGPGWGYGHRGHGGRRH